MINSIRMITLLLFATFIATSANAQEGQVPTINQCFSDLTQSYIKQNDLLFWANEAAVTLNTYNYALYKTQFQEASNYFTPEAWNAVYAVLKDSELLNVVIEKKLIISAVAIKAPIILQQGVEDGRYTWHVQMKILVTYQNATEIMQRSRVVTMLIARTAPYEGVKGIRIVELSADSIESKK